MKKVKGMPITGSRPPVGPKAPILNDAKETSLDLEKRLNNRAQQPFTNTGGAATTGTSVGASGGISTLEPRIKSGLQHSSPGAKALPSGGPVGQRRAINQSGQIGGRMGFPPPRRKAGTPFSQGGKSQKVRKGAAFYGE